MDKFSYLPKSKINELPQTTGVYCFISDKKTIYIGKAINIRNRVKNHFQQPTYRDNLFIDKVDKLGFWETNSEIEALVLEAKLIKENQPKFNVVWRDDKNYFFVAITKSKKPIVYITHQKQPGATHIGPFIEGNSLKKTLRFLRRAFPYYTSKNHPKNKCTWCHLGLCLGPTPNLKEYKKNLKSLVLVLEGKKNSVLNSLKKQMQNFSADNEFEKAAKIRDKINGLQKVMSHSKVIENERINDWHSTQLILQGLLGSNKEISRIECYDISNIQGQLATGSMVVFINGQPAKNQYKKFKIKTGNTPNDIAMLKEIIERRLIHKEWRYPEIMLIDGGIAQLNIARKTKKNKNIKIISLAKKNKDLYIEGRKNFVPLKSLPKEIYNLIVHLDDEAHRFAITYHKKLRKDSLLT